MLFIDITGLYSIDSSQSWFVAVSGHARLSPPLFRSKTLIYRITIRPEFWHTGFHINIVQALTMFICTCTILLTISNLSHYLIFAKVCLTVRHGCSIVFCNSVCRSHVIRHPDVVLLSSLDRYAISLLTSNLAFLFSCWWLLLDGYHFPLEIATVSIWTISVRRSFPAIDHPPVLSTSWLVFGYCSFLILIRFLTFAFSTIKFLFNVALMEKRRSQPCDPPCKMLNKGETDISNMITSWDLDSNGARLRRKCNGWLDVDTAWR